MRYTAGQAAKAVGKSVPTITRAVANGKLSAERTEGGGYLIDPAELHRVFPAITPPGVTKAETGETEAPSADRMLGRKLTILTERVRAMEVERERAEAERDRERRQLLDQVADLQSRLDREGEERRALSARLVAPPVPATPAKRSWWSWGKARA